MYDTTETKPSIEKETDISTMDSSRKSCETMDKWTIRTTRVVEIWKENLKC